MSSHPMQPIIRDENGRARFKENTIVSYLLRSGGFNLNDLARLSFPQEDWEQFSQLHGYSVSAFGTLSHVRPDTAAVADRMVETGESELEAKVAHLEAELAAVRAGLLEPIARLYGIHPENLQDDE